MDLFFAENQQFIKRHNRRWARKGRSFLKKRSCKAGFKKEYTFIKIILIFIQQ